MGGNTYSKNDLYGGFGFEVLKNDAGSYVGGLILSSLSNSPNIVLADSIREDELPLSSSSIKLFFQNTSSTTATRVRYAIDITLLEKGAATPIELANMLRELETEGDGHELLPWHLDPVSIPLSDHIATNGIDDMAQRGATLLFGGKIAFAGQDSNEREGWFCLSYDGREFRVFKEVLELIEGTNASK